MLTGLFGVAQTLFLLQVVQSSVTGTIRDATGKHPLANAVVTLADLDRSVVTDSSGHYAFTDVPPGPQHLTIRCIGYGPRTLHAMVPAEGPLQIDVTLHPAPVQLPPLVVRSAVAMRGLEPGDSTPFPDRGVSTAAIRNDPMLSEPDGLLGLSGGEVGASPESPSGMNLRGAASDQTGYLLDGIPVLSPYHTAGTFTAWNPDALERLQLSSALPSPDVPDALSGSISAFTRAPGSVLRTQGALSTSQVRLAVDGPLGTRGAGYLVSYRAGFPHLIAPRDPSYLRGETSDLIVKAEARALGGSLRVLWYGAENSIGAVASPSSLDGRPLRNQFEWSSQSWGARWVRQVRFGTLRLQAWSASSEAEAGWIAGAPLSLDSDRRDQGLLAVMERNDAGALTTAGVRLERSRTGYRVTLSDGTAPAYQLEATTPVGSVFLQHSRPIGASLGATAGLSVSALDPGPQADLHGQLRWRLSDPLSLTATYARTHQFAQSLRNSESVVGNIFPADLFIGVGAPGVPVARSDRGVLAAEYRPHPGLRLGAQVYLTGYDGLLLVAPATGQPFAANGFTTGSGAAPGFSLDGSLSGSRFGLLARYGWQQVRLEYGDSSYTPVYGTSHLFELGGIVFPSATSSIRLGVTGGIGRRATSIGGSFEWESCNLVDRGCEFTGNPQANGALGGTTLPAYFRLDLSLRKHWHLEIGRRDLTLALFATVTNLLGRTNVLTVVTDPVSGRTSAVEMRPRSPLVAGLDWRF
jgi:carboxypeptidase family protein/TonB-dependent receptor-like protein